MRVDYTDLKHEIAHSNKVMYCVECWIWKQVDGTMQFAKMPDYWKFQPRRIFEPHYFVFDDGSSMPVYLAYVYTRWLLTTHHLEAAQIECRSTEPFIPDYTR